MSGKAAHHLQTLLIVAWIALPCLGELPASIPALDRVDESGFRDGLRQRRLDAWLKQYLADTPPADAADDALRRREAILAGIEAETQPAGVGGAPPGFAKTASAGEGRSPWRRPADRGQRVIEASKILQQLLSEYPQDPRRLGWRLELARDLLERQAPGRFEGLLLYELPGSVVATPGRDARTVQALARQAVGTLQLLRDDLRGAWRALEGLDENAIAEMTHTGALRGLEALDSESAFLLAWARAYEQLPAPDRQKRKEVLAGLLEEVTQHQTWLEPGVANQARRFSALLLCTLAARGAERFEEADGYARQLIGDLQKLTGEERERYRRLALLGVLEQIRILRDRGNLDRALKALDQARSWAARTRPDDISAALALALLERELLARQAAPNIAPAATSQPTAATQPVTSQPKSLFEPAESLAPLEALTQRSPRHRDLLYSVAAGALSGEMPPEDAPRFAWQMFAGAAIAEAEATYGARSASEGDPGVMDPAAATRLDSVAAHLQNKIAASGERMATIHRGELLFLLGEARNLLDDRAGAAQVLCDLVEQVPDHDRADAAAQRAAAIARQWLERATPQQLPAARRAFVRAGRLLRGRVPEGARPALQYAIALTLEQDGQFEPAAREYAAVPGLSTLATRAAVARARCLRNLLVGAAGPASRPSAARIDQALAAARQAFSTVTATAPAMARDADCLGSEAALLLASLLDSAAVHQPSETLQVLEGFDARFAGCPGALGAALRERIIALQQLGRLAEARQVVQQFLKADPAEPGQVLAGLLQAMHAEITAAADRGDEATLRGVSAEAAELASTLLDWASARPGKLSAEQQLTVATWRGCALVDAGRPQEALDLLEKTARDGEALTPASPALRTEIRLARARALLALGRPADALTIFTDVWQKSPEQSDQWWQGLVGSLQCHTRLGSSRENILQTIRQQRALWPDLVAPRYRRALEALEQANREPATRPSSRPEAPG